VPSRKTGVDPAKSTRPKGGKRAAAGRPKKPTTSEKKILDRARSRGRRHMDQVMRDWIREMKATKHVYGPRGEIVGTVPDFATRQEAKRQIADRCGFRFDPKEAPPDLGNALVSALSRVEEALGPEDDE
jgi:hypothetical protein